MFYTTKTEIAVGSRIRSDKHYFERKTVYIFIPINLILCFGAQKNKEPSH